MDWDVVVAGGSFAGLATAGEVQGTTVILDRHDLGAHQTSACGTFVRVLEEFGCESAILRTFDTMYLHTPRPNLIRLVEPLCTFDYEKLCMALYRRSGARFVRAAVRGRKGRQVVTDVGPFTGTCLVDATGWRATLALGNSRGARALAYGVEVDTELEEDSMHFFVDRRIVTWGAAWIFPTKSGSRVGVASYGPTNHLKACLRAFLDRLGVEGHNPHGGAIPWDLRGGACGDVFLVGDAAGMALPLTLEGIRRSLHAGRVCGRIVNDVFLGRISMEEGLQRYDEWVRRGGRAYKLLQTFQRNLCRGLDPLLGLIARLRALQKLYLGV